MRTRLAWRRLRWSAAVAAWLAASTVGAQVCWNCAGGASSSWVDGWSAPASGSAAAPISDQTIRQSVRLTVGGTQLQIRLSNQNGTMPIVIGTARVAIGVAPTIVTGTDTPVLFGGRPSITIPVGATVLSDPVPFATTAGTDLAVSLYLLPNTSRATTHQTATQTGYVSPGGDFTRALTLPAGTTVSNRYFITDVDVLSPSAWGTVVALGDSITQGDRAATGANARYPDFLAQRLQAAGLVFGVANKGIGGARVTADAVATNQGQSSQERFDTDVLAVPGVTHVVFLQGINDIGFGNVTDVDILIAGHRQMIARAHQRGLKIVVGTLTPFQGFSYYTDARERLRQAMNDWIRSQTEYDGIIDFDAVVRDPANPLRLAPACDSGDHIHPAPCYGAMAEAVPLSLFVGCRNLAAAAAAMGARRDQPKYFAPADFDGNGIIDVRATSLRFPA